MRTIVPIRLMASCLILPLLALAGCEGGVDSVVQPVDISAEASHGSNPSTEFNQGLAELRRAMARFHNFETADAAGYATQLTVCWYYSGLGAMGYHYGNPALIDGVVELLEPEILVYEPRRDGSLRLVALEYIVPIAAWMGVDPPSVLGQGFHDNGAGLYVLHIWLWRHNPSGMFADWNPKASCQYAAVSEDRGP